ncbi:MAG: peptidylprolyl isomerase [Candidatus Omnitrophica bacterium]|nr:peptidylprolyl isomerase [Candidatus Omnitrophota bacterium]
MRYAYHRQVAGVVCGALLGVGLGVSGTGAQAWAEETPKAAVQNNMDVGLEYTLTVDGAVVDTTEGKPAFHYIQGKGQIIPGLERQLVGLHIGDAKEITVTPEEGYGKFDPAAIVEVPKEQLPKDMTPAVGMALRGVNPDGKNFRAMVHEVKEKTVVLDLNHPLAGKTLNFKVKVVGIAPASAS